MGTCRIFIAPKFDERGLPMLFRDQKGLFVELDKFTVNCKYLNSCSYFMSDVILKFFKSKSLVGVLEQPLG